MSFEIKRGLVVEINWNPHRGSEQAGIRPAVIIQNDIGNKYSPTTIVAASTTAKMKAYPFVVHLEAREAGLTEDSTINCSAILTVDKTCIVKKYDSVSENKMKEIDRAILASLGIKT